MLAWLHVYRAQSQVTIHIPQLLWFRRRGHLHCTQDQLKSIYMYIGTELAVQSIHYVRSTCS